MLGREWGKERGRTIEASSVEVVMDANDNMQQRSARAVLAMAEIKAAAATFDQGDQDVFEALSAIAKACEPYRVANHDCLDAA